MLLRAIGLPSRRLGQHPRQPPPELRLAIVVRPWFSSALAPSHVSWFDHGPRTHLIGLISRNVNLELYRVDGVNQPSFVHLSRVVTRTMIMDLVPIGRVRRQLIGPGSFRLLFLSSFS